MNQHGTVVPDGAPWGPLRIVYLQYASDPVTFFDVRDLYRAPAWLESRAGRRFADLGWFPVVTMLQIALDMGDGDTTPMGYGHVYATETLRRGLARGHGGGRLDARGSGPPEASPRDHRPCQAGRGRRWRRGSVRQRGG